MIVHLVREIWFNQFENRDFYESETLREEGFIHCSSPHQVGEIRERYFRGVERLVVLVIDPYRIKMPLKFEPGFGGALFPHIYGPLNMDAVVQVVRLPD